MAKFDDADSSYVRFRGGDNKTSTTFLGRLRDRDSDAWKDFMEIYAPLIRFWCRERKDDLLREERKDILQEVLQKVSLSIDRFDHSRKERSFRGWLRRITENQILDHLRLKAKGGKVERLYSDVDYSHPNDVAIPGEEDEEIDPDREAGEQLVLLKQILNRIKPEFREKSWDVFRLLFVAEKDSSDVAETMGMKDDAVRQIRSRILKRIREEYAKLGIEADLPTAAAD